MRVPKTSKVAFDVPLLNARWGMTAHFTLDVRRVRDTVQMRSSTRGHGSTFSALVVGSTESVAGWLTYLRRETKALVVRGRSGVDVRDRTPSQLPSHWMRLSGFDLISVNFGAPELTEERQQTLARYVAGGGNLIVSGMPAQSTGPLRDMCRNGTPALGAEHGRYGLGRWISIPGGCGLRDAEHPELAEARSFHRCRADSRTCAPHACRGRAALPSGFPWRFRDWAKCQRASFSCSSWGS